MSTIAVARGAPENPLRSRPVLLYVITRMCVGGAQLTVVEAARDFASEYDVRIAFGPDVGAEGSLEGLAAEEFPTYRVPLLRRALSPREDVGAVRALRAVYADARPSIIHTHSSKAGIVGRAAAAGGAARVVHSVHGWGHTPVDPRWKKSMLINAERRCARLTEVLIAVSGDVKQQGLQEGIGVEDQYRVVPNYVDYTAASPDFRRSRKRARAALGLDAQDLVVGWVGRFVPQKDPTTLAEVVVAVLRARSDVRVAFVGDGPDRPTVEGALAAADLSSRAIFAGFRTDVRQLYSAFDVLVHTSRWEGQPRVLQESIAERVPVVTADVTGAADLLSTGRVGDIVRSSDAAGIAEALLRRLADGRSLAPLPETAVAAVAEHNGYPTAHRGHHAVYKDLLTMGPRTTGTGRRRPPGA